MARAEVPPKALGKGPSSPLPASGAPGVPWLVAASLQPVSSRGLLSRVCLCLCFLIGTSVIGSGSTLRLRDLILTSAPLFSFVLCVMVPQSCLTPRTVAHQAPPSMEFSRREYWSGLLFPSPGHLPDPGTEPRSPTLQADSLLSEPLGKPMKTLLLNKVPFTRSWSQDLGASFGGL